MGAQLHLISSHSAGEAFAKRELDVVFVHGLGGDAFGTWRFGEDDTTSWPHWLSQDQKYGKRIGVWSFGYPASRSTAPRFKQSLKKLLGRPYDEDAGYSMPLPDRARNALDIMAKGGIGQRPYIFIVHSLGGLLVKYMLSLARDADEASEKHALITNCKAVLFLATPHQGSELATQLSKFRFYFPSITIDELRENDSHLRRLFQWYRRFAPQYHIDTRSFFESRATGGVVVVVTPDSADPGTGGEEPVPLDADHLAISRPKRKDDAVVLEAKKLIKDQLDNDQLANDQLPLNPQPLKSNLSEGSIPDPFPETDFHLKVFLKATHTSEMGLLGQGYLSCTVFFLLCQGQEVLKKSEVSEGPIVFSCDNPEPLIKHLEDLQGKTLDDCGERLGNRLAPLPLHLHLKLPYTWLSGALPERIQQALKCHVFFGCSNRSAIAKSAVTQLRDQAMQVNQRLHSGSGLSSLLWATVCHQGVGQAEFEQLFAPIPDVIHLNSPILDDEHAHSDLVGRDALLSTEPRLLFPERFSTAGNRQGEATGVRRWRRLVVIGLPLVLWWRADGTEPKSTNLDHLPRILQSSWQEFCGHLELIAQMVNSQEPEKLTMKALMTNIGIFYEDPLRNSPQDQDPYRHPVHAPT
jgi:hypothetical protein